MNATPQYISVALPQNCISTISTATPIDEDHLLKTINDSSTKTCHLDPLPTSFLKSLLKPPSSSLLNYIARIVNKSLHEATFPSTLKKSLVVPVLKKTSLDADTLTNYRPILNLTFLSKLVERVVPSQIETYLSNNNL